MPSQQFYCSSCVSSVVRCHRKNCRFVPDQSAIIVAETTLVSPRQILEDLKKVH